MEIFYICKANGEIVTTETSLEDAITLAENEVGTGALIESDATGTIFTLEHAKEHAAWCKEFLNF